MSVAHERTVIAQIPLVEDTAGALMCHVRNPDAADVDTLAFSRSKSSSHRGSYNSCEGSTRARNIEDICLYLRKAIGMRCDDSDVAGLRTSVVRGDVLLDCNVELVLLVIC